MHSVDSAESPKNWGTESPTKNWFNQSESSDSESFKQWESSTTPPKQWLKSPEAPIQKTWIKIPSLADLNSPRKWEAATRSVSPELTKQGWVSSSQKYLESQKSWLNIPHPDSPKQQWMPKTETGNKNWIPINLPKLPNSQKTWASTTKKQEPELLKTWNSVSSEESNTLTFNNKRSNSPSWLSPNQKKFDPSKTWKVTSPNKDQTNCDKEVPNEGDWGLRGLGTPVEKNKLQTTAIEKGEEQVESPISWNPKTEQPPPETCPKPLPWLPSNAVEGDPTRSDMKEPKPEPSCKPSYLKSSIWSN